MRKKVNRIVVVVVYTEQSIDNLCVDTQHQIDRYDP